MAMKIIFKVIHDLIFFSWDLCLTLINLLTPDKRVGQVVPQGHPGFGGQWPEYIAPKEGDSRCSCPALNAMANHGILPRDGKNIQFKELGRAVRATYNFSPTFCYFVPHYAAGMLKKQYSTDRIDLKELDLHNGIEHDASLIREDSALEPDQSKPQVEYIKQLLSYASGRDKLTGEKILTVEDLSKFSSKRRVDARETNKYFTLNFLHKMFGSINTSTLLEIFGGRVKDLETWLIEERIPDGWETKVRERVGVTLAKFNLTVLRVELGISEKKYLLEKRAAEDEDVATVVGASQGGVGSADTSGTRRPEQKSQSGTLVDI